MYISRFPGITPRSLMMYNCEMTGRMPLEVFTVSMPSWEWSRCARLPFDDHIGTEVGDSEVDTLYAGGGASSGLSDIISD